MAPNEKHLVNIYCRKKSNEYFRKVTRGLDDVVNFPNFDRIVSPSILIAVFESIFFSNSHKHSSGDELLFFMFMINNFWFVARHQ